MAKVFQEVDEDQMNLVRQKIAPQCSLGHDFEVEEEGRELRLVGFGIYRRFVKSRYEELPCINQGCPYCECVSTRWAIRVMDRGAELTCSVFRRPLSESHNGGDLTEGVGEEEGNGDVNRNRG